MTDALVALLNQKGPIASVKGVEGALVQLGYDPTPAGALLLRGYLMKYKAFRQSMGLDSRNFSFETGKWAKNKASDTNFIASNERIRASTKDRLVLFCYIANRYYTTASADLNVNWVRAVVHNLPQEKKGTCASTLVDGVTGTTLEEVQRLEYQLAAYCVTVLAPFDPAYAWDLPVLLERLRSTYRRYTETVALPENQNKCFSVHTARWGQAKRTDLVVSLKHRVYAIYAPSIELFLACFPPSNEKLPVDKVEKLPVARTEKLPVAKNEKLPLPVEPLAHGERIEVTLIQAKEEPKQTAPRRSTELKVVVPTPPVTPDVVKESWQKLRISLWFHEQKRLAEWGIESYFDGKAGRCFACLLPVTIDSFEAAHILPRSRGGADSLENLRVSCAKCNHGKNGMGTIHAYEWLYMHQMKGLALISASDKDLLIGELLYRQQHLLTHLLAEKRLRLSKDAQKAIRPSAPLGARLTTTWHLFQEALPGLSDVDKPVAVPAPTNGCLLM
ncbi:Hypothetical protein POVN_LOCUS553 [uncultured virus]|nr:Hypothetical protein POVN_LOCUS553 [uncultured virus]